MDGYGYIIVAIIFGVLWGVATQKVITNKGYDQNWFWWGFFFSIIAFIVALTKPDNNARMVPYQGTFISMADSIEIQNIEKVKEFKKLLDEGIITQDEFERKKKELLNL